MTITLEVQIMLYKPTTGMCFKNIEVETEWAAMLNVFFLILDHSFLAFCP